MKKFFPIKYKFLSVLLGILLSALAIFFYFAYTAFSEDKKLFIMDLNLTLLRASSSEIKLEIRSRMEELQVLIPRIYSQNATESNAKLFENLTSGLPDELLSISFYKRTANGQLKKTRDFKNKLLFDKNHIPNDILSTIEKIQPVVFNADKLPESMQFQNRSIEYKRGGQVQKLPILTITVNGTFASDEQSVSEAADVQISINLIQDFLRAKLQQSDLAELFLMSKSGKLISHSSLDLTVKYAKKHFQHPVKARIKEKSSRRESMELKWNGETYLCNIADTGLGDIVIVAQLKKSEAFVALFALLKTSALIAALIFFAAVTISVLFAARLTSNIEKLRLGAEQIGTGNFDSKIEITSNDEILLVAQSFDWMSNRLKELMQETAHKARMEEELKTAQIVQETLLKTPVLQSPYFEVESYYVPASECGGDIWDAEVSNDKLTIFVGDATGHGAPAAIVTAVAKSCFSTLTSLYSSSELSPAQFLSHLNRVIYTSCRGQLLMTMSFIQIDLKTGQMIVGNAGHECPFMIKGQTEAAHEVTEEQNPKKKKSKVEVLFGRGERLGFDPGAEFTTETFQLDPGDTILIYTDGVSEAKNVNNEDWSERALKKSFGKTEQAPLTTIREAIVQDLTSHMQTAPQADDITFVLLRYLGAQSSISQVNSESTELPMISFDPPMAA